MSNPWTIEEDRILKELYHNTNCKDIAKKINRTVRAIQGRGNYKGYKKDPELISRLFREHFPEKKKWSKEQDSILMKLYPDNDSKDVAVKLGKSLQSVYARANLLGCKKSSEKIRQMAREEYSKNTGFVGRQFKKGHKPANKGKKREEYMTAEGIEKCKKFEFKKGMRSVNLKPIGTIRAGKDRTLMIKVKNPRSWMLLSHVVWMKYYGPVPKGYNILYKDRNPKNIKIENLEMVSNSELMLRNSVCNYPEDLQLTIRRLGMLNRLIKNTLKKQKDE